MIRALATLVLVLVPAFAAAGCVGPRVIGAAPQTPAWLGERISEAERSRRAYPTLADTPDMPDDARSPDEWAAEIAELEQRRDDLLADPMLDDPDAEGDDKIDAQTFIDNTRRRTEREIDRQTAD